MTLKIRLPRFLRSSVPEDWKNPFYKSELTRRQILKRDALFHRFASKHFKIAEHAAQIYKDSKLDFESSKCNYLMAKRDFHHARWKFWCEKRNAFLEGVGEGSFSVVV